MDGIVSLLRALDNGTTWWMGGSSSGGGVKDRHSGLRVEHKTCDIFADERLRLMRFDHRLIIDSFQKAT